MKSIVIAGVGLIILLVFVSLINYALKKYKHHLKEKYAAAGTLSLGKMSNTDVPISEIKDYLKLTNTF